jgi:threonine/homoserine/homoserine lactone efflux protein
VDPYLRFGLICAVLVVVPGPTFAVVIEQTWRRGQTAGLLTVAGNSTSLVLWATASVCGLSAILVDSARALTLLRFVGGVVLGVLGMMALRRIRQPIRAHAARAHSAEGGGRSTFHVGLLTNLTNPKPAIVYLTVLPSVVSADCGAATLVMLALLQVSMSTAWYSGLVFVTSRLHRASFGPLVGRWLGLLAGGAMMVLGVDIALSAILPRGLW